MDVIVHGADSETLRGKPMTLQFFSDDTEYSKIYWVNEKNATDTFFKWANALQAKHLHVVYVHNLEFDLPEFFWSFKDKLITVGGEFELDVGDWHIKGVYARPTFCKLTDRKHNRQILIVDSFLWFQGSLAKAGDLFCPDLPKLKHPEGLGSKQFKKTDSDFIDYAMRDAVIAYHIGKSVQEMIAEFDIMQPVSLADMSAKIFRHHFVKYTIPQPVRSCVMGALKSYHGGKNNVISDAAPGWHLGVTSMDISSAYPYAMSQLPSMSFEKLYKRYKLVNSGRSLQKELPPLGVYQCSGVAVDCEWPVIFEHAFKPIRGKFRNVWIQGFELNEALATGEVKLSRIRGYYYEHEKDNRASPFKGYCDHFYHLKETEKDPVRKYGYKLNLNSVYGKFIQTRKNAKVVYTDVDTEETTEACDVVAGGMFHPFIASAITAHTRAYIHQIEHAHKAIHTATDGIYTKQKRVKHVPLAARQGLGKLTIEAQGDLVLLRNKCYILYGDKTKKSIPSQYFKQKNIVKYAKHGFQGTVYDLEKLIATNTRKYKASRPNRLREALKRGLDVNDFVERPYTLKVGPIPVK